MEILPGFQNVSSYMKPFQVKIYAAEHYLLIGLYTFLFVLVNMNFWTIIIQQKRYKTMPLMAFYIFAYLSISFRLTYTIW